jgi:hypothetical protein
MAAGCTPDVSAATTAGMSLGEGSSPGTQSQRGQTGKDEGRTKRSGSFHDITQ